MVDEPAYKPGMKRTDELVELTLQEESDCVDLRDEIARRWPGVVFRVGPHHIFEVRGVREEPRPGKRFGVAFENGPRLEDMRDLINGRTDVVNRFATVGAVLWLSEQNTLKSRLGASGADAIATSDLSDLKVISDISAIDEWASQVGMVRDVSKVEGYDVLFAAQARARSTGTDWLKPGRGDTHG